MKNLIFVFLALCFGLSTSLLAQNSTEFTDKTESPYFFVQGDGKTDLLPLKHTEADVNIAGVIANVKVTQRYKNEGKNPIEAIYTFPGSTQAAVYGMQMKIGERTIKAKIEEKEKARADYEQAKQQGKSASLLEQQRPNVFQMNVANIMPGDVIEVELLYTELLIPDEGIYEFVYPTVVGPRYSGDPQANPNNNDGYVSNPYLKQGEKPPYTFDLKVSVQSAVPIQSVSCASHVTHIDFNGANEANIKIADEDKAGGNKDFILRYQLNGQQIQDGILLYEGEKENFFLMMMQPPERVESSEIVSREYIFIVDVSGSMNGYPLDVSKKLLRNLIGNLQPHEKFNVLLFAGTNRFLSETSIAATPQNIDRAINTLQNERGGGGTNILSALQRSLAAPKDEGFSRSYIIVTDGYVSVEPQVFEMIEENLGDANFYAFGIGNSVNRHIIEGMARVGMGEPFVVTKQAEADAKAEKLRKYIQSPVLTDIKVSFEGVEAYDIIPAKVPDLMAERPIVVFGKYKGSQKPNGIAKVTGTLAGGRKYLSRLSFAEGNCTDKNNALRSLWARHKIKQLSDYSSLRHQQKHKQEITDLGLQYNLLTNFTSFIAIDSQVRNENGEQTTVKQALPLPEGVSNHAVGYQAISSKAMMRQPALAMDLADVEVVKEEILFDKSDEPEIFTVVEQMPEYPDGQQAMMKFLLENIKAEDCKQNLFLGNLILTFVVNKNGSISGVKVKRSSGCESLDKEAIKAVENMPQWTPGKQRGVPVKVQYNLPIRINLK